MVFQAVTVLITIAVVFISAVVFQVIKENRRIKKKLHWIPSPPGLPLIGHALQIPDSVASLSVFSRYTKQFGGLCQLQIGVDRYIIISDYKYLEHILSSTKLLTKAVNYKFLKNWLSTGLLTSTGEKLRKRRKIITPAFHFSILSDFISVFDKEGQILVKKLEKVANENRHFDVFPYVTLCALDIICETAMGISINAQSSEYSEYVGSLKTMLKIVMERTFSAVENIKSLYPLTKNYRLEKEALKVLHSVTDSVIDERRGSSVAGKAANLTEVDEYGSKKRLAFLDILLQATVDGKPLSNEDIREEVDTFMFEGHDTTTSTMCFALYCLSTTSDEIVTKVLDEQKYIYGDDRDRLTTLEDLQNMKYLDLFIKEVLRVYPSVPMIGRFTDEDYEFEAGKVIPKGVNLMLDIFDTHRNPAVFKNPDTFDPSRWETLDSKKNPYSFIPFSAGSRNCIGQRFAMLEIKCTVSKILRHFEVLPAPPGFEPVLQAEAVLTSANGVNIVLRKRKWD